MRKNNLIILLYKIIVLMNIASKLKAQYNYINDLESAGIISTAVKERKIEILRKREQQLIQYQQQVYKSIEKQILKKQKKEKKKGTESTSNKEEVIQSEKTGNLIDSVLKNKQ
jgi:hypothetical protein